MTRTIMTMSKGILYIGAITACLASTPALAQIRVEISPPAAYIATATPVYYEGRPSYWYGNQWHYRDGRSWRTYREEPAHLREYRGRHEDRRHYYGRAHEGGYRHR
jgi:hypothetical protein